MNQSQPPQIVQYIGIFLLRLVSNWQHFCQIFLDTPNWKIPVNTKTRWNQNRTMMVATVYIFWLRERDTINNFVMQQGNAYIVMELTQTR